MLALLGLALATEAVIVPVGFRAEDQPGDTGSGWFLAAWIVAALAAALVTFMAIRPLVLHLMQWAAREQAKLAATPRRTRRDSQAQAEVIRAQIRHAEYGNGGTRRDVTAEVNSYVSDDGLLDIEVSNEVLGGDPAVGHPKTLCLTLTLDDGSTEQVTYKEGERAIIPPP